MESRDPFCAGTDLHALVNELSRKSIAQKIKKEVDMSNGAEVGKRYLSLHGKVFGQVNDGNRGLHKVEVALCDADAGRLATTHTDLEGFFAFDMDNLGNFEVRFPKQHIAHGKPWELPEGKEKLAFALAAGEVKLLDAVSYQPETFIIKKSVLDGNHQPANGILVDVRPKGAASALQSARTKGGLVTFVLNERGTYVVSVYPDPNAFGSPTIDEVDF